MKSDCVCDDDTMNHRYLLSTCQVLGIGLGALNFFFSLKRNGGNHPSHPEHGMSLECQAWAAGAESQRGHSPSAQSFLFQRVLYTRVPGGACAVLSPSAEAPRESVEVPEAELSDVIPTPAAEFPFPNPVETFILHIWIVGPAQGLA